MEIALFGALVAAVIPLAARRFGMDPEPVAGPLVISILLFGFAAATPAIAVSDRNVDWTIGGAVAAGLGTLLLFFATRFLARGR